MQTIHRNYSEETGDFKRLCRFIIQHNASFRRRSTWSLGRIVDWKFGLYEDKRAFPAFCNQNAHLWFDGFDELVGFVISESGDAGFAILTLDGYRFLYEEMLDWAMRAWGSRPPCASTEITENQPAEAAILERCGFRLSSTFFTRRFDLSGDLAPRAPLAPGFTIVDLHTHPDYRQQRILRHNAFHNVEEMSEDEIEQALKFYNFSHKGPIYHPQCDLCVMAADGQFVSGCEALIDAHNAEADIERVCTHSQFRKRGFARAVIQECLYRLRDMGLTSAYIAGYSPEAIALYGSLGAVDEMKSYGYELPIQNLTTL